jgi:hypothetical protein
MMRAVWSFWSKPYAARKGFSWGNERYHLLAWCLSLLEARQHYPRTLLVTDTPGKTLLVDRLGLPFEEVLTALDELAGLPAHFWVLGKLYAYRMQARPFVHIDTDVFLWKPLPGTLVTAGIFAQNPETINLEQDSYYHPDDLNRALELTGGWRPPAWIWALDKRLNRAVNCGILGGTRLDFIQRFAADAIRMILDPANQPAWQIMGDLKSDNILFEQYFLGAYLAYEQQRRPGPQAPHSSFLFSSMVEAFDEECARERGYTHLIGGGKTHPELLARLEAHLMREYPEYYERCINLLKTWKGW